MTESRVREVAYQRAPLGQRAKPALILTIGEVKAGADHPTKLDYFRPKPGPYADTLLEKLGAEPREIPIAVADDLEATLDIRWKAYGKSQNGNSYLKALGHSNYVERALSGDISAVNGPETLTIWWQDGRKGELDIDGPGDPAVIQHGLKVYTTFRFWIPEVLGLGSWAEIATTSEVSTHNLYRVLTQQWRMLNGQWIGLPLVLYLQEAKARPVVEGKGRITSKFWALAVRTPLSVAEFLEQHKALAPMQTRAALPPVSHDDSERDHEISQALFEHPANAAMRDELDRLPTPADEPLRTRSEANAAGAPDDATVNRIATLRLELGDVADSLLVGAYGVEDPAQLDAASARAYVQGLERLYEQRTAGDEAGPPLEGEHEHPIDDDGLPEF